MYIVIELNRVQLYNCILGLNALLGSPLTLMWEIATVVRVFIL